MSRKFFLVIGTVLILIAVGLFVYSFFKRSDAGLRIESDPAATVFINGEQVGVTPLVVNYKPGELRVKLVPFSQDQALIPYETKIDLMPGVETVIRRQFAKAEEQSSGETLSFEKIGGKSASLSIVSSPDSAQVEMDGKIAGFTPFKIDPIDAVDHRLRISAPGYAVREVNVFPYAKYRLTIAMKLAKTQEEASGEQLTPEEKKEIQVEILPTPTGFLRVRAEPSTQASEVVQVKPGGKYNLLEENSNKQWFKIEYEKEKQGWISSQYAKKLE